MTNLSVEFWIHHENHFSYCNIAFSIPVFGYTVYGVLVTTQSLTTYLDHLVLVIKAQLKPVNWR